MIKTSTLVRFLGADLPSCPDQLIELALTKAAIKLCRESHCWSEIQGPTPMADGQQEYSVDGPDDGVVVAVRNVWAPSRELLPKSMEWIQTKIPNWATATSTEPAYYNAASTDPDTIRLFPIPLETNGAALRVRVSFAPSVASTSLHETVVERYLETLLAGARYRLMLNPGKAWSNAQLAAYYKQEFDDGIANARGHVAHDYTPSTLVAQPRRFR